MIENLWPVLIMLFCFSFYNIIKVNQFLYLFIIFLHLISSLSLNKSLLVLYAYVSMDSIDCIILSWFKPKGATKWYFTHYSCVAIILFKTALCRSALSTGFFRKLVFRLSVLSLNQDIKICVSSCYVILVCSFVLNLYKNSPFINNNIFTKVLQYF